VPTWTSDRAPASVHILGTPRKVDIGVAAEIVPAFNCGQTPVPRLQGAHRHSVRTSLGGQPVRPTPGVRVPRDPRTSAPHAPYAVLIPVCRSVARRDDRPRPVRSRGVESTEPEELISLREGRRSRTHRSSRSFDVLAPDRLPRALTANHRQDPSRTWELSGPDSPDDADRPIGDRWISPVDQGQRESPDGVSRTAVHRLSTRTLYATMIHPPGARK
jgi:hypothetical protein